MKLNKTTTMPISIENKFIYKYSKVGLMPTLNKKKTLYVYLSDNSYKREFKQASIRMVSKSSIRFLRARQGLPVRGQRTNSNGRTAKKRIWLKKRL